MRYGASKTVFCSVECVCMCARVCVAVSENVSACGCARECECVWTSEWMTS